MLFKNFIKFIKYYGKGYKLKLFGFLLLSLIAGGVEFLGVVLIYPFILLMLNPASITHSKYYVDFASFINVYEPIVNAFILGFFVIFIFIFKNIFMIWFLYLQNTFIKDWEFSINKNLMHYYLYAPYKDAIKTPSSEKIYNLNFLVQRVLDGFIFRIISFSANIIVVLMLLVLLFIKFPLAACVTSVFIIVSMKLQNKMNKKRLSEISQKNVKYSSKNNDQMLENINNLKEIKILCAENYFDKKYTETQRNLTSILAENNFYILASAHVIEIFVVLALFIIAGIIAVQNFSDNSAMIASYAVIAAALFRIAPSLNRIQTALNSINASSNFTKTLIKEYEKSDFSLVEEDFDLQINFENSIRLNNISFAYKEKPVIENLDLEIRKGEFIGVVGLSGAGKSTLADIIMGLLPVDEGEFFIDNIQLNHINFKSLRKLAGYVPQQINVLDGTIKRNVAWGVNAGVNDSEIISEKVTEALKKAQLLDYVNELEGGIEHNLIKGGSGLSQGQKQRLAIARALYRNPEILILDEATSSLDVQTENEITQMLNSLKGEKTIIAIAHRLSTLKSCNRLIYLKDGKIIDSGSFDELSKRHSDFENLIKLSNIK